MAVERAGWLQRVLVCIYLLCIKTITSKHHQNVKTFISRLIFSDCYRYLLVFILLSLCCICICTSV